MFFRCHCDFEITSKSGLPASNSDHLKVVADLLQSVFFVEMTSSVIFDERFFVKGAKLLYEQNYLQNHDNPQKICFSS